MTLGQLIALLEACNPCIYITNGFSSPHSYRGYYDELAFEPAEDVSVAEMLETAKSAVGKIFQGYKGGEYTMDLDTLVHVAYYGTSDYKSGDHIAKMFYELGKASA